jgi:DNA-binding transcriptional LysR family regulator
MAIDNLSEMAVFARVVQSGGFSAAARDLNLTPSAVSKQIGRLEDRLGARLLNRTTRRQSLTEVGAAFYQRCSRILADVSEAEQSVVDLQGVPRGTLRVNLPVAFGRLRVMPLVPKFLAANPELRIELTFNDRIVDLVEEGVDLAIRVGELSESSLIARRLAPNRRVVCGAPGYFERAGTPERPADLIRHNCLVYIYRAARNTWRFQGPEGAEEVIQVTGTLESNDGESLRAAALAGLGVVLLPQWLIGEDICNGRLVQVMAGYHAPDNAVYAVYPPSRHLSPKVRGFVDLLARHFAGRDPWTQGKPAEAGSPVSGESGGGR